MGALEWITQFGQMGASAALTATLGYILFQLPRILESERASREKVAENHARVVAELVESSREQFRYEREGCDARHKELIETTERRHAELLTRMERLYSLATEVKHETSGIAQRQAHNYAAEISRRKGKQTKQDEEDRP